MSIKIRHGLLDVSNYPNNKRSSIILNDDLIFTSATILEPYFQGYQLPDQKLQADLISRSLTNFQLIKVQEDPDFNFLKDLKFEITFDQRKLEEPSSRILTRYRANLRYIYNCKEVSDYFESVLNKLHPDNNGNNCKNLFLSSFIILNVIRPNELNTLPNINGITNKLIKYCKFLTPINKLDDVMTICSPFGLENFYKTINIGKVSNVLGQNRCLFVISNTLPNGCEGSAVFNNKLRLIGVLICTSLERRNENFNISLAANFRYLIKNFSNQYGMKFGNNWISRRPQPLTWERSLLIVTSNGSQGTGFLVKIMNKKFVLTCSHVVFKGDSNTTNCRYVDGTFASNIIWKNPNCNEPFDVAVLSAPSNIPDSYFARLSNKKPQLGQSIFNAGFPFFTNTNVGDTNFEPAIFEGRIIKCSPGVLISDGTLQAGQSGGPMFDDVGAVLGICVSNLKLDNTIYPNLNTSVPVCDIKEILEKYAKSNDNNILNKLVASASVKSIWALETPFIACKL